MYITHPLQKKNLGLTLVVILVVCVYILIRFINCVKKREDISTEDFRSFWLNDEFENLVREMANSTKAIRYVKNLTLTVDANVRVMEDRGSGEPFDGVIEYWWSNARDLMDIYETPEFKQVAGRMLAYQRDFIDIEKSSAFFTENN